jgi:hypothetical protein
VARFVAHPEAFGVSLAPWMAGDPSSVEVLPIHRNEVFGAGKNVDARLLGVPILWEPLTGLSVMSGKEGLRPKLKIPLPEPDFAG